MLGRLQRPADFESVLATPVKARSAHFAAHHLPRGPGAAARPVSRPRRAKLSTSDPDRCPQAVDDTAGAVPGAWWFGVVVPKRHARKATTRNLLRRQIRGAMARHHEQLPTACGWCGCARRSMRNVSAQPRLACSLSPRAAN